MNEKGFGIGADLIVAAIIILCASALALQRTAVLAESAAMEFRHDALLEKTLAISSALVLERDENFSVLGSAWRDAEKRRIAAKTIDRELLYSMPESGEPLLGLEKLEITADGKTVASYGKEKSGNCVAVKRLVTESVSGNPIELVVRGCD
ncbi:MAG: hypothetical protein WC602_01305 [archaeon]